MINSTLDKQMKHVASLGSKVKARREEGMYMVEDLRVRGELNPEDVDALYITENFARDADNRKWMGWFRPETVDSVVMNTMADTRTPQEVLAVVRQKRYTVDDIAKPALDGRSLVIMVLEAIQDPGNFGTTIRAGEGAGITGIVMNHDTADTYDPKVTRSTMGSILRMPLVYADDLQDACLLMKNRGVRLFAVHLKDMNNYGQEDYAGNVDLLIGDEANGLTEETTSLTGYLVKIPMEGEVESLNVAIAASILMFEIAKQRRNCSVPAETV